MSTWWFPDNTVLCNFAAVGRLDVLEKVLDGRGRWTEAVAHETRRSASYLSELRTVFAAGWLGDPIEISGPRDSQRIETIRRAVFGGTRNRPLQHLGEAQTCHVIEQWDELQGSLWITDDRDAFEYAVRRGITACQTVDVVAAAATGGILPAADGYRLLHGMLTAGRHLHRFPSRPDDLLREGGRRSPTQGGGESLLPGRAVEGEKTDR